MIGVTTQAERRARSREALLEAAARGISRDGYAGLSLERVAAEAGYTRGALYHQFAGKEELALAVVEWVQRTWDAEVRRPAAVASAPVERLLALARGHVVYCRRDIARVLLALRVEFTGRDHPVGQAVRRVLTGLADECAALVTAGQRDGSIPAGPVREIALAYLGVVETTAIQLAGATPYDEQLVLRAARGVLGLPPTAVQED